MMSHQPTHSRYSIKTFCTFIALFIVTFHQSVNADFTCSFASTPKATSATCSGLPGPNKYLISALALSSSPQTNNQSAFTYTAISQQSSLTLSPLQPDTQYQFSVTQYDGTSFASTADTREFTTPAALPKVLSFTAYGPATGNHWSGNTVFYLIFDSPVDSTKFSNIRWSDTRITTTSAPSITVNGNVVSLSYGQEDMQNPPQLSGTDITVYTLNFGYDNQQFTSPPLTGYLGLIQGATYAFEFMDGYSDRSIANSTVPVNMIVVTEQFATLSMIRLLQPFPYLTMTTSNDNEVSVSPRSSRDVIPGVISSIVVSRNTPNWEGEVAIRCSVGGSTAAAEQSATLIVKFVNLNTPPSIISTNGALSLAYGSVYTIGDSIQLSDAQSTSGADDLYFMTVTASPGAILSFDTPQTAPMCIPACNDSSISSGSFLIEGSLPVLQTTLGHMLILQVFPDDVTQPSSLTISLDDRSNGGKAPSNYITSQTIPINVHCNYQSYVSSLSAALSSTRSSIVVKLSTAVDPSFVAQTSVDCGAILSAESMEMFNHATCRFANPKEFIIVFGYDSTWTRDRQIIFQHTGFPVCSAYNSAGTPVYYDPLSVASTETEDPSMSLVGPQSLPFCSNCTSDYVVFTAVTLTNLARLPNILWNLPTANFNNSGIQTESQQLRVPLSAFTTQGTFNVSFTIVYLGWPSQGAYQNVEVTNSQQLVLLPENSAVTNMIVSQPLSLGVSVWFGSNIPLTVQTSGLTFHWDVPGVSDDQLAGETSPNLYIKPQSLSLASHTITVTCTLNGQSVAHVFIVQVTGAGIYAVINGGDLHGLPVSNALTLDGSLSYDLMQPNSALTYGWQCKDLFGAACVNRATGGHLNLASSSSAVTLPVGAFFPGLYLLTLTVTNSDSNSRQSSASVHVNVYSNWGFEVLISTIPIDEVVPSGSDIVQTTRGPQRTTGGRVINSGDQLTLYGAVVGSGLNIMTNTSVVANANNTLFTWSITGGPNPIPASGMVGVNRPLLVVNSLNTEGFFVPGYTYTITLTVSTLANGVVISTGQSSLIYYINRPPVCSFFKVNLDEGDAFDITNSVFAYSFQAYDPDEDTALSSMTYQMYRIDLASGLDYDLTSEMSLVQGSLGALTTGNPDNNFYLTLGLRAWDRFRATSLTPTTVISRPPATSTVTISQLIDYYVAVDAVTRTDSQALMSATANVISALSSRYVDYVADASDLPNYASFQREYLATKKYLVMRVIKSEIADTVRASILVDFLAIAMSDYTTLDRPTIGAIIDALTGLMSATDNELWDDITGDSHVLAAVTYVLQQSYHACSFDFNGLLTSQVSNYTTLSNRLISPQPTFPDPPGVDSDAALFSKTKGAVQILLNHLKTNVQLSGDVVGLNFNRSLSGMVSKLATADNVNISTVFPSTYWSTEVIIAPSAFSTSLVDVSLLQIDGWGDKISFDIFPTIYVDIADGEGDHAPYSDYPARTVNIAVQYEGRACFDGWVNSGKFRFSAGEELGTCRLSCARYDESTKNFTKDDSMFVSWDKLENVFTCAVNGPGYYTVLKENANIPDPAKDGDGIVYASIRIVGATEIDENEFKEDVSYLLDVPPIRIDIFQMNHNAYGNQSAVDVYFKILAASSSSPLDSYTLYSAWSNFSMLATSHTPSLRNAATRSRVCYYNSDFSDPQSSGTCAPAAVTGLTKNEVITIGVVVGFFGMFILAALLFCCGKTIKYWWDRHDFMTANGGDDDEELDAVEVGEIAEMSKIGLNEPSSRRGNKVSWYNGSTREIEDASNYTYSRNSQPSRISVSADSRGRPSFRVSGEHLDGEQVDDIEVIGGEDSEVDASELAEIAVVVDEGSQIGANDEVHYMDGKKVRKVQQVLQLDADSGIDDSAMSRSRASSLNSNSGFEYSQSGRSRASSNASESSLNFSDNEDSVNELSRNRANTRGQEDGRRQYYK